MAKPTIIGLTGFAGTGKDTVREMLESDHNYIGMAFADPMRAMVGALFSKAAISSEYMLSRELKEATIPELGVSYRHIMQTLGTEWGRTVHSELWVRLAVARMQDISANTFGPLAFVFSDVRFPNEAQMIRERGGQIWHIERPGTETVRQHASEANVATIKADRVLTNNSSIEALWILVASIIDRSPRQSERA